MSKPLHAAIGAMRLAAAQSRNVKLDSALWKAIETVCKLAEREAPPKRYATDADAAVARFHECMQTAKTNAADTLALIEEATTILRGPHGAAIKGN